MRRLVGAVLFVVFVTLALPVAARAQDAEPLQKSDIIRLLSGTNYTQDEIAGIIRQSCLTFTPTARDQSDFRGLGASETVLDAITGCGQQAQAIEVSLSGRQFTANVGGQVTLNVAAARNGSPAGGVGLVLRGSSSIRGATGRNLSAQTDADGRATFRISAGTEARSYNLSVEAASGTTQGARSVTLSVTAGGVASATLTPAELAADAEVTGRTLQIAVVDQFGNRAAETELSFVSDAGQVLATETTGPDGMLTIVFPLDGLGSVDRITVRSGDVDLGSVPVGHDEPSAANTGFVAGTAQAVDAGMQLPDVLVLEVRDASGAPLSEVEVTFRTEGGGAATPSTVLTDRRGRAETSVTLGSSGRSTRVVAVVADFEVSTDFEITVGGMTGSEFDARLATAAAALDGGDARAAADLYGELNEADPDNLDAMIGYGLALGELDQYEESADLLRRALRVTPTRLDAQKGLAEVALELGEDSEAARWFGVAVSQAPNDVDAWVGLGEARAAGDRKDEARQAFERALVLDPDNEAAQRGIASLSGSARVADFQLWGGYTSDNGRSPGIRMARVEVWPARTFALWVTYDNGLYIDKDWMVRGSDDIEGFFGGVSVDWGSADQLTTKFEIGRRNRTTSDAGLSELTETDYFLDQKVRLEGGNWWNIGGYLGHYGPYDDDWGVHTEFAYAANERWTLMPTLSYVKNIGSDFSQVGDFVKATELRLGLDALYETERGAGGGLAVNYGNVGSDVDTFDGSLWEGRLLGFLPLGRMGKVLGFVRYQNPPGMDSFVSFFLGLDLAIPR